MRCPTRSPVYPLHLHTKYSVLDGADDIGAYIEFCVENGIPACACTDHGYVMGLYDLIKKCWKAKVKPIPGCEVYLHPGKDYRFSGKPYHYNHLTLWAMNQTGYRDLCSLGSMSFTEDRSVVVAGRNKPRVTWSDLEMFGQNLICGTGCIEGPVGKALRNNEPDMAAFSFFRLMEIFRNRLYVEIMPGKVIQNYSRAAIVEVEASDGQKYRFHPQDVIVSMGVEMTAAEAMTNRISDIDSSIPLRAHPSLITSSPGDFLEGTYLGVGDMLSIPSGGGFDVVGPETAMLEFMEPFDATDL